MPNKILEILPFLLLLSWTVLAGPETAELTRQAVSEDPAEARKAIQALREQNQAGLNSLLSAYAKEIATYKKTGEKTADWQKISKAIDGVAKQKDAYSSGLFWYTDLKAAQREAQKAGKPILSLRLLGNLDEEYSCANSRFFRSILYSNANISGYLKENYILHWKSVRPAPKITIDFGDGRKLVRTITGNSIHYVLDSNGQIIDALPGLYNPPEFYNYLVLINRAEQNKQKDPNYWQTFRESRRNRILAKWQNDLKTLGTDVSSASSPETVELLPGKEPKKPQETKADIKPDSPTALSAARLAVTKAVTELPTVRTISYDAEALKEKTSFEEWKKLAELNGRANFDASSQNFIFLKSSFENNAEGRKEFSSLITNLEKYVSIDTVQNEYVFHTRIYQWLNQGLPADVESFNEKVYAELFLTPKSDQWLGLYSPDIYSAIENNGIVK